MYNFRTTTAFIPLIFILFLGITLVPAAPALAGPAEDMLALVNRERARAGLSPVTLCPQLTTAARVHVNDMIANDFFSHTGSDGSRSWDRIGRAGYQWRTTGENLAYEYGTASATNIFNMWMGSSGHRANILNSSVQHMGLYTGSVMEGSWRKHYWVQTFGASNTTCQNTVAPGVTVSPSQAVTMEENETINYTIRLTTPPSAPVTIRARTSSDACWVGGSPAVLNANNYNTGVTFRVKAVIDDIIEPDEACNLWTLDPQSSDPTYDALTMRDTPNRLITVRDNDEPRIVITPARRVNLSETGAQSQTYTVKLLARPTANVRFALRTSSNQCTLSTSQVELTTGNYKSGVQFTVTANNDSAADGDQACNVWTMDVQSSDPNYNALTAADSPNRLLTILDDDGGQAAPAAVSEPEVPTLQTSTGVEDAPVVVEEAVAVEAAVVEGAAVAEPVVEEASVVEEVTPVESEAPVVEEATSDDTAQE